MTYIPTIAVLMLALGLASCSGANSSAPTAPSSQPAARTSPGSPDTQVANVTLSGVVYEITSAGRLPIAGAHVLSGHDHNVITDTNGFFSFKPVWVCPCSGAPWVEAGITHVLVDKDGYADPTGQPASIFFPDRGPTPGLRDISINGDTRFDIQLVRP